jgi:trk system potassium uptake protein TrkH
VKFVAREMLQALHPRAVRRVSLGERVIPRETLRAITGFFVAYFGIFAFSAVAAGVMENDLRIGLTGSIVTLGNIGPGFGALGPMETFADLSVPTKLLFLFNMWVGRLEVMTVLVLFHPDVARGLFARRRRPAPPSPEKNEPPDLDVSS